MMIRRRVAMVLMGSTLSLSAMGADAHAPPAAAGGPHAVDEAPGPVVSQSAPWAPQALMIFGILFVSAAFVGPIYRLNMPEEPQVEDFHSHDEPPGTSHHHGASGTIDHSAPDKPHHH